MPAFLVRCPLLLRFFSRLCWWPTVLAETCQVVVCDCTRDRSFRSIARPPGRYLFRSGSCGHLPHGVCPHATLMTTSTTKTQWTVANTVAFGRGMTMISTRYACVENEIICGRGFSVLVHMRCVFLTDISLVSTMTIWSGFQENTFVCWCTCTIMRVRCACKVNTLQTGNPFTLHGTCC